MKRQTWRHKRCGMHRNPYSYPYRLILVLDRITVELMIAHTIAREDDHSHHSQTHSNLTSHASKYICMCMYLDSIKRGT